MCVWGGEGTYAELIWNFTSKIKKKKNYEEIIYPNLFKPYTGEVAGGIAYCVILLTYHF